MDDLLKALADAIRAGTAFAMPALVGYYVVRVVEAITPMISLLGVAWAAKVTIIKGMLVYHEKNANLWIERRKAHEAWLRNWAADKKYPAVLPND